MPFAALKSAPQSLRCCTQRSRSSLPFRLDQSEPLFLKFIDNLVNVDASRSSAHHQVRLNVGVDVDGEPQGRARLYELAAGALGEVDLSAHVVVLSREAFRLIGLSRLAYPLDTVDRGEFCGFAFAGFGEVVGGLEAKPEVGVPPKALARRSAISEEMPPRSLTRRSRVWRVTPEGFGGFADAEGEGLDAILADDAAGVG
jgi:hypothetical protein